MSSKRSVSVCSRSPKFYSENQFHNSHLFSSTCSANSQISKSPFETIIVSHDDIQGSSAILAAELDKLILINAGLTKEISTWKRKYKECYRLVEQHIPMGIETEVNNNDYKDKYTKLKCKAVELKKASKVLENVIIDKNQEIGAWKQKYAQMEQEYIDQIQNLRNQIEIVLKTQIEKEVTLAFSSFEKEKVSREEDWAALIAKLNQSQVELKFVSEEKDQALRRLEDLREKLTLAESQNSNLGSLQREYRTLNEEYEKTLKQVDQVREQLSAKEVNCKSIQAKYTALSSEVEKVRALAKEHTARCDVMRQEVQSLNEEKEDIAKQLEQSREQLKTAEKSYKEAQCRYILKCEEVERLRGCEGEKDVRVEGLRGEIESCNREKERVIEQLEDVKAELVIAQDRSQEAQSRVDVLNAEVERLSELVEEKDIRLERIREELAKSGEAEKERDLLKVEVESWRAMSEGKVMEVKELQEKVRLLAEEKEKMEEKIEKMNMELYVMKDEYEDSQRINTGLKSEVKKYKEAVEGKEMQVSRLEEEIREKENQIKVKEGELRGYQDKVLAQQEELKVLQESIVRLNEEIVESKAKEYSSESRMAGYIEELRKKDEAIEAVRASLKAEVELKERLEQEIKRLELERSRVSQEKDALLEQNGVLECMKDRIQEYEETFKALRKERSELRARLEAIEKESIVSFKNNDKNIEQYEKRIQVLIERNGSLTAEVEELQFKIEKLNTQALVNEELRSKLAKNDIFFQDLTRLLGVDIERSVSRIEEMLKDIALLSEDNLSLKNSLEGERITGQEGRVILENRLRGLEASLEQLKTALDGEQGTEGMLKKIEGYKREIKRLTCEAAVLKKRYEDLEMRNIQEIDRIRGETESAWKKRMETELESKNLNIRIKDEVMVKEKLENEKALKSMEARLQNEVKKNQEHEVEIKGLMEKNEKLNLRVNQLVQEVETSKAIFEEEKVVESRLTGLQFELEKERRTKEFINIEKQLKEKISFHEEQAKNWKAKVEDFELRQVMYFIEIERLYSINAGLIDDVNRLTLELRDSSMELEKNRKMILDATKLDTARSQQRDQFDEVARDLTKQFEGFERKLQSHFGEKKQSETIPLRVLVQNVAIETPVKQIDSLVERRSKKGQYSSIQKSHAELKDLAAKFESEKKTMETQLVQLKKIVDMNKSEMKRLNQDNTHIRNTSETLLHELNSPSIKFEAESPAYLDQPRQSSCYGTDDIRPKSPFQHSQSYSQFTSAGKENLRNVPPLLTKSASQSILGFRNPVFQRDDDSSGYPKISVFKC